MCRRLHDEYTDGWAKLDEAEFTALCGQTSDSSTKITCVRFEPRESSVKNLAFDDKVSLWRQACETALAVRLCLKIDVKPQRHLCVGVRFGPTAYFHRAKTTGHNPEKPDTRTVRQDS